MGHSGGHRHGRGRYPGHQVTVAVTATLAVVGTAVSAAAVPVAVVVTLIAASRRRDLGTRYTFRLLTLEGVL